jgi:shikimate kinase
MRLVYCGFMGAGKSKLGRLSAPLLGLTHYDLDDLIVQAVGMPIPAYFAQAGEDAFRAVEASEFDRIAPTGQRILSVGGGALRSPAHVEQVKRDNILVWIDVPITTLLNRVIGDKRRPLANSHADPETSKRVLAALYDRRLPLYQASHLRFRPEPGWSPDQSARHLTELIRRHVHPD